MGANTEFPVLGVSVATLGPHPAARQSQRKSAIHLALGNLPKCVEEFGTPTYTKSHLHQHHQPTQPTQPSAPCVVNDLLTSKFEVSKLTNFGIKIQFPTTFVF